MKKIFQKIHRIQGVVLLLCGVGFGAIDSFDSTVVRTILDKIGWRDVTVGSVVSSPISVETATSIRVTSLNLNARSELPVIKELPPEISQLPELITLTLKGNALTGLPDTVSTLHKLSRLDLSRNRFSELPAALEGLPLQVLIADYDSIEALPQWIGTLSRLQSASFANNRLTTLPVEIIRCTMLTTLNCDSNMIDSIPTALTEVTTFRMSINANRLCSVDEAVAEWLDAIQLTSDWRATQRCETSFTSVYTEAVTGTVVHVSESNGELITSCRAVVLSSVETGSLSWFTLREVLKAVSVTFGDCFTGADSNYFLITFSWEDIGEVPPDGKELAIYYAVNGTSQYLGGTVDLENKTVSVRANREGQYMLTMPDYRVDVRHSGAAPAKSRQAVTIANRNGTHLLCFAMNTTQTVRIRLLGLDGTVHAERIVSVPAGSSAFGLTTLFGPLRNGYGIIEVRSDRLHSVQVLRHFR